MFSRKSSRDSILNDVSDAALVHFNTLLAKSTDSAHKLWALNDLRQLLDSLALGTDEYDIAVARVNNATRYLETNEPGAAKFEVRMLIGGLRPHLIKSEMKSANNLIQDALNATMADVNELVSS